MPSTIRWMFFAVALPLVVLSPIWNEGQQPMNGWGAMIVASLAVAVAVNAVRDRWLSKP